MLKESTYLVQQLDAPYKNDWEQKVAQAFGGGMLGLSQSGWDLLGSIFSIHYMGAAEYEFGTLPKLLGELAKHTDQMATGEFIITGDKIAAWTPQWEENLARRKYLAKCKKAGEKPLPLKKWRLSTMPSVQDKTVYFICFNQNVDDIKSRIFEIGEGKSYIKSGCRFKNALNPSTEYDAEAKGWLELDNGFFFFIDKVMWERTRELFLNLVK
jgi:hypothetical protein